MEVDFTLEENDLVAIALYQFNHSPRIRKRIRRRTVQYLIGFSLFALGSWLLEGNTFLLIVILVTGLMVSVLTPVISRRRVAKDAAEFSRERKHSSWQKVRITDEGLENFVEFGEAKYKWSAVDGVESTSEFVFISLLSGLIVIPQRALRDDQRAIFMETIRQNTSPAAAEPVLS